MPLKNKVIYFILALAVAALLTTTASMVGCTGPVTPTYEPSCAGACQNARALCGPTTLTPRTGTCEDVCVTTESGGGDFRAACLASAKTCDDVKGCGK